MSNAADRNKHKNRKDCDKADVSSKFPKEIYVFLQRGSFTATFGWYEEGIEECNKLNTLHYKLHSEQIFLIISQSSIWEIAKNEETVD